eukprot:TRINITY_DN47145_c0_g1_i1.p1 TRINITY_DN47145_c0_g1~~TRINITY_DN47145_c0_g1_i1.p1  ORF type:complete len:448 (-),score=26.05 TRINITY_DN47145_c0_g1_i1:113-1456(-)
MLSLPQDILLGVLAPYLNPVDLTLWSNSCTAWRTLSSDTMWWLLWNYPDQPFYWQPEDDLAETHTCNKRKLVLPFPDSIHHSAVSDFLRRKSFPKRVKVSLNRYGIDFDGRPIEEQDLRQLQYERAWRFFKLDWHMYLKQHGEECDDNARPGWEEEVFGWDDELAAITEEPDIVPPYPTHFEINKSNDIDYALRPTESPQFNRAFDAEDTTAEDPWNYTEQRPRLQSSYYNDMWQSFLWELRDALSIYGDDFRARYHQRHTTTLVTVDLDDKQRFETARDADDMATIEELGEKYFPKQYRMDTPEIQALAEKELNDAHAGLPSNYYTAYGHGMLASTGRPHPRIRTVDPPLSDPDTTTTSEGTAQSSECSVNARPFSDHECQSEKSSGGVPDILYPLPPPGSDRETRSECSFDSQLEPTMDPCESPSRHVGKFPGSLVQAWWTCNVL